MHALHLISFATKWILFFGILSADLKVNGVKLAYDEIAPPEDKGNGLSPIIMMHGAFAWRKDWKNVAPTIARYTGRKVFSIDSQNHGESPWTDKFSLQAMVDDLDEFLLDHSIDKAVLVGQCLGGKTAIVYSLQKPEKVEKIILEDTPVKNVTVAQYEEVRKVFKMMDKYLPEMVLEGNEKENREFFTRIVRPFLKKLFYIDNIDFEVMPLKRDGKRYTWLANFDFLENADNFVKEINLQLSGVFPGEAFFIYGTQSFTEVGKDEMVLKIFPRAKLLPLPGWHNVHHQFPERFIEEVSNFINGKPEK